MAALRRPTDGTNLYSTFVVDLYYVVIDRDDVFEATPNTDEHDNRALSSSCYCILRRWEDGRVDALPSAPFGKIWS